MGLADQLILLGLGQLAKLAECLGILRQSHAEAQGKVMQRLFHNNHLAGSVPRKMEFMRKNKNLA